MIMNHRPASLGGLNLIIEELEQRFPDPEAHEEIVGIIAEVLGTPDSEAEKEAMTASANSARERQMEAQTLANGEMEVDGTS